MKSTRKTDSSRHFRLIRALQGKRAHVAPNQPISFGGDHRSSAKSITHGFIRQYAPLPSSCKRIRLILRQMEKSHPIDGSFSPFTFEDTVEAIKMSKNSTAVGPDGLAPWHLKNIGRKAISYLTSIFNLSVATAEMPSIWKMARIIPVLKPGKSADKGISYRPISLLCPAVKILERLILPYLTDAFNLAHHQHGFRRNRSTTSALLPLVNHVATGIRQPKPPDWTVIVALDISKAFDRVDHTLLIEQVKKLNLHPNLVRWLRSYLSGRQAFCDYQGVRSSVRRLFYGVPQGSVISPILFNFFVSDFPECAQLVTDYADDFTVAESGPDITELENRVNDDLRQISDWARRKKFDLSSEKSTVTLFTSDPHQVNYHPQVFLDGFLIPLAKNTKILGMTLDPMFMVGPHSCGHGLGSLQRGSEPHLQDARLIRH